MKVLISHPTGNAFFRSAALGFSNAHILSAFRTTIAAYPGDYLDKISKIKPLQEFSRRKYDPALKPFSKTWPWYELGRFAAAKGGLKSLIQHETGIFSVDGVYTNLDKRIADGLPSLAKGGTDAVYAYEDGALYSFRKAKQLGIKCLYDLPIGYWRSAQHLLSTEKERWPEWASTLTGLTDSKEKLERKDEELRLADKIFVASRFTANTLKDYPGPLAPIEVIPYGFPPVGEVKNYRNLSKSTKIKLLFVGGLSQRKGIADLFAVANKLEKFVELTVVGRKATDECEALNTELTKHKWIPSLNHDKILQLMREHDVLIFPSLFEGFGLVITEAMSQGTPVITTERTAGPDLIKHGENGWLINAGSTDALQSAIEELLDKPDSIANIGRAAMATALNRPWETYGKELVEAVRKTI